MRLFLLGMMHYGCSAAAGDRGGEPGWLPVNVCVYVLERETLLGMVV